jgi:DNA-binding CsgD family transcriptional regulator
MQTRVATLAARGDTSLQIGVQLGVSANTVKFHLKRVYELLGVGNRIELRHALDSSQAFALTDGQPRPFE